MEPGRMWEGGEGWLHPKHQVWTDIFPAQTRSVSSAGRDGSWKLLHHGHSQASSSQMSPQIKGPRAFLLSSLF